MFNQFCIDRGQGWVWSWHWKSLTKHLLLISLSFVRSQILKSYWINTKTFSFVPLGGNKTKWIIIRVGVHPFFSLSLPMVPVLLTMNCNREWFVKRRHKINNIWILLYYISIHDWNNSIRLLFNSFVSRYQCICNILNMQTIIDPNVTKNSAILMFHSIWKFIAQR